VVFYDPRTQDREQVLDRFARDRDKLVVPPFDDHRVMAGQGTVGLEILEQLDAIDVVPISS
jgi:threonine dehydratase